MPRYNYNQVFKAQNPDFDVLYLAMYQFDIQLSDAPLNQFKEGIKKHFHSFSYVYDLIQSFPGNINHIIEALFEHANCRELLLQADPVFLKKVAEQSFEDKYKSLFQALALAPNESRKDLIETLLPQQQVEKKLPLPPKPISNVSRVVDSSGNLFVNPKQQLITINYKHRAIR